MTVEFESEDNVYAPEEGLYSQTMPTLLRIERFFMKLFVPRTVIYDGNMGGGQPESFRRPCRCKQKKAQNFHEMLAEVNCPVFRGLSGGCRGIVQYPSTDEPSGFGLSTATVERLTAEGKVNTQTDSNLRTNRQIISENLFTVFNLVNALLAAAVFIVSLNEPRYFVNLAFIFVAIINTAIGIIQEIRLQYGLYQHIDSADLLRHSQRTDC